MPTPPAALAPPPWHPTHSTPAPAVCAIVLSMSLGSSHLVLNDADRHEQHCPTHISQRAAHYTPTPDQSTCWCTCCRCLVMPSAIHTFLDNSSIPYSIKKPTICAKPIPSPLSPLAPPHTVKQHPRPPPSLVRAVVLPMHPDALADGATHGEHCHTHPMESSALQTTPEHSTTCWCACCLCYDL